MATATSRRAPVKGKPAAGRKALAAELLKITREILPQVHRIDVIEADLKKAATEAGMSFTEVIAKLGKVTVAPGYEAEFKGNVPVIQTEAWLKLKPAERKRLEKSGLIKIESQWGRASSGKVTTKLLEGVA